jgi:hypothetical protein
MKLTPNPIPHAQGVYALVHRPSQSVYIGSSIGLRGRAAEWKSALKHRNHRLRQLDFPDHPLDEWEFRVLKITDGVTYEQLRELEAEAIKTARDKQMVVLNKNTPATHHHFEVQGFKGSATFHANRLGKNPSMVTEKLRRGFTIEQALGLEDRVFDHRAHYLSQMPVPIVDEDGNHITYSEAAEITGRSQQAIKDACKFLRAKKEDLKKIHVSELYTKGKSNYYT